MYSLFSSIIPNINLHAVIIHLALETPSQTSCSPDYLLHCEPVQCPGGGRCSPAEGCLTKVDLCRKSTNEFRTCYIRDQNEFEIATPFEQPLIGQDEIW